MVTYVADVVQQVTGGQVDGESLADRLLPDNAATLMQVAEHGAADGQADAQTHQGRHVDEVEAVVFNAEHAQLRLQAATRRGAVVGDTGR